MRLPDETTMLTPTCRGRRTLSRRARRGVQFIEFALILPAMLYLLLFSIDMGRMVFLSGIVHDGVFYAAREGAIAGGAGDSESGPSRFAFDSAVTRAPGTGLSVIDFQVLEGTTCTQSGSSYVRVRGTVRASFITPGLRQLLNASAGLAGNGGRWDLTAVGISRCEIARS